MSMGIHKSILFNCFDGFGCLFFLFVCLLFKLSSGYVPSRSVFSSLITKTRLAEGIFAIILSSGSHKESIMSVNTFKAFSQSKCSY